MGTAVAVATRLDDPLGQAMSLRRLALACYFTADYDRSRALLESCLLLYQRVGNRSGEAIAQRNLSIVAEARGRHADALGHTEKALFLFQANGHQLGEAASLGDVGWYRALLGDHQQARATCQQALILSAKLGGCRFEAAIRDTLGYIELQLGNFAQAAAYFEAALLDAERYFDALLEAVIFIHLGDARHAAGELPQARQAWQQALAIYEDIDHPGAGKVRAKLAGMESHRTMRSLQVHNPPVRPGDTDRVGVRRFPIRAVRLFTASQSMWWAAVEIGDLIAPGVIAPDGRIADYTSLAAALHAESDPLAKDAGGIWKATPPLRHRGDPPDVSPYAPSVADRRAMWRWLREWQCWEGRLQPWKP